MIAEVGAGLDLAAKELSDLDFYMNFKFFFNFNSLYVSTIEKYLGIPYGWGDYNVVIMPPSFPFGGMENPLLTFASPSIIDPTGSKSGIQIIAIFNKII